MVPIFLFWGFVCFISGIEIGIIIHKRKRDKEMAHIVAGRLLGKKADPPSHCGTGSLQSISQAQQAMSQQLAANAGAKLAAIIGGASRGAGQQHGNSLYDLDPPAGYDAKQQS